MTPQTPLRCKSFSAKRSDVQEMIMTPLRIDGGAVYAADEEAAAHHWRVMRMVMKQVSFWEETY